MASTSKVEQSGAKPHEDSPYSMTEEILQERLNKRIHGHVGRQIFAGFLACLASLSFGTALGWTHSVGRKMHELHEDIAVTPFQLGWLVSIMLLGCSLGVTLLSLLMSQMGPKRVLQVVGPFYILNWWLTLIPNIRAQLAGRFFLGFLGITYCSAGEALLMQTVDYGIRRYIAVFYNSMMIMGVVASRIMAAATTTFWLTMICAAFPFLHYVLIQLVPESPVYLFATSHVAAAKSLAWYRGEGNFYMDMANIKRDWDASRQDSDAYQYMLFSRVVYRALLVVMGVTFIQISAGYFIFMFYSIQVLSEGKVVFTPFVDTCIVGAHFVVARMFWRALHTFRSWKVRGLLISSCFLTSLFLALFAVYLLLNEHEVDVWVNKDWLPLVLVFFLLFFYEMGLNHFSKILVFEYMPFQMYKKTSLIIQGLYWLLAFINILTFAATFAESPSFTYFMVLAGLTFVGGFFCCFCVVEPKGKSLIQIQLQFGGNPIGNRGTHFNQTKHTL